MKQRLYSHPYMVVHWILSAFQGVLNLPISSSGSRVPLGKANINFYVEIECQLDATEVFIADIIACSTCFGHHYAHHQELKIIIQWLLPMVFGAVVFKLLVWC